MPLPREPANQGDEGKRGNRNQQLSAYVQFTPMAFDGIAWVRITAPQSTARAACLSVTAYISLLSPGTPLRDLDTQAEAAIRALEEGSPTATVIDDRHRVDRVDLRQARDSRP